MMPNEPFPDWYIYPRPQPSDEDGREKLTLPPSPPWRNFGDRERRRKRGVTFRPRPEVIRMVNAALYLRRPLLITGLPGTGKSSLAFAVAENLGLGAVLEWSITSRSRLKDGLYEYDAIGRLQDSDFSPEGKTDHPAIEKYIRLGPLGSAFADTVRNQPRVLLIDEIDKSDIDLPNDLLNIFEEGEFTIPELKRNIKVDKNGNKIIPRVALDRPRDDKAERRTTVPVPDGVVRCVEFPFVVLTSNGERELPPAFLRRCLRLEIAPPEGDHFRDIVRAHFRELASVRPLPAKVDHYIQYVEDMLKEKKYIPTDQVLNAIHMVLNGVELEEAGLEEKEQLARRILRTIL